MTASSRCAMNNVTSTIGKGCRRASSFAVISQRSDSMTVRWPKKQRLTRHTATASVSSIARLRGCSLRLPGEELQVGAGLAGLADQLRRSSLGRYAAHRVLQGHEILVVMLRKFRIRAVPRSANLLGQAATFGDD